MRGLWGVALALIVSLASTVCAAADNAPVKPLFASQDILHIRLQGPISRLIANRSNSSVPIEAALSVDGDGSAPLKVKLSLRGITRRRSETCDFPPIRIDIEDKAPDGSLFRGQKKLKLTTHCNQAMSAQQLVLLEYTAYRLYQVLTPVSFSPRLTMVDYVNPDGRVLISRLGFLLENDKDVARRNGLTLAEVGQTASLTQLSPHDAAREVLFEYMIGNLDWSMLAAPAGASCCHNTKLLARKGETRDLTPVPYDFDFSGLVDAPYATPPEGVDMNNVVTRLYRGHCAYNAEAIAAAGEFRDRRAALLARIDETPQLDESHRRKARAYLDGFFRDIATDKDVSDKLLRTCLRPR